MLGGIFFIYRLLYFFRHSGLIIRNFQRIADESPKLMDMEIFEFEIPSHTTRREWAVYIIKAEHKKNNDKFLYVGKVGDNRDGCNPIISRIGNHFSHNRIHSQMRNKISAIAESATTDYEYKIYYSTFGKYSAESQQKDKDRINEMERHLNRYIQQNLQNLDSIKILNPYYGIGVNKKKHDERQMLLMEIEKVALKALADKATN